MVERDEASIRVESMMDKLGEVKAYRGHPLYASFVHLLGLIDDSYRDDLVEVSLESLKFKQGAARQCRMLRRVLIDGDSTMVPKV